MHSSFKSFLVLALNLVLFNHALYSQLTEAWEVKIDTLSIRQLKLSIDSKVVYPLTYDNNIRLVDSEHGKITSYKLADTNFVYAAEWLADSMNQLLLSVKKNQFSDGPYVYKYDTASKQIFLCFKSVKHLDIGPARTYNLQVAQDTIIEYGGDLEGTSQKIQTIGYLNNYLLCKNISTIQQSPSVLFRSYDSQHNNTVMCYWNWYTYYLNQSTRFIHQININDSIVYYLEKNIVTNDINFTAFYHDKLNNAFNFYSWGKFIRVDLNNRAIIWESTLYDVIASTELFYGKVSAVLTPKELTLIDNNNGSVLYGIKLDYTPMCIVADIKSQYLFVGSKSGSVYKYKIDSVVNVLTDDVFPARCHISNGCLQLFCPEESTVSIYTALGEYVTKEIVNKGFDAINLSRYTNGCYFIVIESKA